MNFLFVFALVMAFAAGFAAIGTGISCIDQTWNRVRVRLMVTAGFGVLCAMFAGLAAQANSVLP